VVSDEEMSTEEEDAIYAAYLGICVLKTMCRKAGLRLGEQRAQELLIELGTAFTFIPRRVGLAALRSTGVMEMAGIEPVQIPVPKLL
jgi:hypothetical protein